MAFTQSDLDALKRAIAGGQVEVQYGDKRVRYRSLDEMKGLLRMMQEDVNRAAGRRPRRLVRLRHAGKGV
ncbi:MAG: hypothetical protein E2576_14320 [Alcaligenaceae bacterium]|nr:hypothetical protein [Alcaligenaceae bacterium SAGV5]MPS50445.1 hypothetical protein [Alcaligenaceae bacterium SAGV3]MPT57894.1 hypothetical protein [Alcaligenaceae bacterium]